MKVLSKFKRATPLLLIFLLTLVCCNSRKQSIDREESDSVSLQPVSRADSLHNQREAREIFNDSLVIELLKKYPAALNMDSINLSYTIFIQDLLDRSSNLIFEKNAFIKDVEKQNESFTVTFYTFFPNSIARLQINPQLAKQLISNLKMHRIYKRCCFVATVKRFIPISTELVAQIDEFTLTPEDSEDNVVTEKDISDYVHVAIDNSSLPFYFIKGELIDFYILK